MISSAVENHRALFTYLLLAAIMVFGALIRVEDLREWNANPEMAFYDGDPLLTNLDGYYYLRIARDLGNDNYSGTDMLRATPHHPERRFVAPLIATITADISKYSKTSLIWVAVFLPCFLGVLIVLPIYGIGKELSSTMVGVIAAIVSVTSYVYFKRTSLGYYDTDCLNITFSLLAVYFPLRFILNEKKIAFGVFVSLFNFLLFYLWWDQATLIVTVISLYPIVLACLLTCKIPKSKIFIVLQIILFSGVLIILENQFNVLSNSLPIFRRYYSYLLGISGGDFPSVSQLVGEQKKNSIFSIASLLIGSFPAMLFGAFGVLILIKKEMKKFTLLLAVLGIGILGVFYAERYLLFLVPIIALGFGYAAVATWHLVGNFKWLKKFSLIIVCIVVATNTWFDLSKSRFPQFTPQLIEGFKVLEEQTPPDAVIWTWWDWGHPLIYYSNRATIADGAFHGGVVSVYSSVPFATDNMRFAANFINFYSKHGFAGLQEVTKALGTNIQEGNEFVKKILSEGPEVAKKLIKDSSLLKHSNKRTINEWLDFFFVNDGRPVYLFFDYNFGQTVYWWYWLGTWNFDNKSGTHTKFKIFPNLTFDKKIITNNQNILVDRNEGRVTLPKSEYFIKSLNSYNKDGLVEKSIYENQSNLALDLYMPRGSGALQKQNIRQSVFNRLFIRHEKSRYFSPVVLKTPLYQVYRVVAD